MTYYYYNYEKWNKYEILYSWENGMSDFITENNEIIKISIDSVKLLSNVQYNINRINNNLSNIEKNIENEMNWRNEIIVLDTIIDIRINEIYFVVDFDNEMIKISNPNTNKWIHYENKYFQFK